MAAQLSVEALCDMFSSLSTATIRDVVEQCGNNCEVAMEHLLSMAADSPSRPELLAPAPVAPRTREAAFAMLFPSEKKVSSTRAEYATSSLTDHTTALTAIGGIALAGPPSASGVIGTDLRTAATLDAGQPPGLHSTMVAVPSGPALPVRCAAAVSRGWWPEWRTSPTAGACPATRLPLPSPLPSATLHPPSNDAWGVADNLLGCCKHRTPPRGRAVASLSAAAAHEDDRGQPGGSSLPSGVPPPTPLQDHDELPRPGKGHTSTNEDGTLCHSDEELADLFPGLAHVLASPSPSGTCSPQFLVAAAPRATSVAPGMSGMGPALSLSGPVPPGMAATAAAERLLMPSYQGLAAAEDQAGGRPAKESTAMVQPAGTPEGDGYDAAALVQAVEFHLTMFPSLKAEVVADVLQRHADAPQTALDQLIMLQRCVDDAAATAAVAGELPDPLAWESCSGSGSEDEHGLGGGGAGASWAQDLTPEELAAMEQGTFPPDLLEGQRHEQPAAAAPAGGAGWLSQEDQLAVLKAQFGGMPDRELAEALGACDGDVFAAAELLRSFMAEDAAGAGMSSAGLNGGVLLGSMAGVAATVPAPAALPSALLEPGGSSVLPQHVGPKVQHLARRFPGAPTEALQVALAATENDLVAARRTLRENGYSEVEVAFSPAASAARLRPPPGLPLPQPVRPSSLPQPVPLPLQGAAQAPIAPPALPSLSEASYQRNQSIFEEERAYANRLQAAYRRCFALAQEKHAAGEHETAAELRMKGHEYKQQYEEERRKASRRISMRVNQAGGGGLPVISVDLHCAFVHEALETVESGIRNLPESIPGGVVVRYITGKGLHSAESKARIKPEVIALLQQRGVPYREGPGWVEATLLPDA